MSDDDVIHQELSDFFNQLRERAASDLTAAGLPLTDITGQVVVERTANGFTVRTDKVRRNVLRLRTFAGVGPWVDDPQLVEAARAVSVRLLDRFAATLPFWDIHGAGDVNWIAGGLNSPGTVDFEIDAVRWVLDRLVYRAASAYLAELQSVGARDDELAQSFAAQVVAIAADDGLRYVVTVPLVGVLLDSALVVDDVTLRPLSPEERGDYIGHEPATSSRLAFPRMEDPPTTAGEIRIAGPRDQRDPNDWSEHGWRLATALALHGIPFGANTVTITTDPPWLGRWRGGSPLPGPETHVVEPVDEPTIRSVLRTRRALQRFAIGTPATLDDRALHRFMLGVGRRAPSDSVIDFVIALEALLLRGTRDELRFQFGLNGAHFRGGSFTARNATFDRLRDLYKVRSGMVHGGGSYTNTELLAHRNDARQIADELLLKAVEHGFPTPDAFRDMALGKEWLPSDAD